MSVAENLNRNLLPHTASPLKTSVPWWPRFCPTPNFEEWTFSCPRSGLEACGSTETVPSVLCCAHLIHVSGISLNVCLRIIYFLALLQEIDTKFCGVSTIANLADKLKPRYHFAGLEGVHYERLPYRCAILLRQVLLFSDAVCFTKCVYILQESCGPSGECSAC